jgi:sugar lactone lactonase YvrE
MKYLFLTLLLLGLMVPLACNNVTPTSNPNTGGRSDHPTFTPTNQGGYTSTPTATLQPTPAYVGTITSGISAPNGIAYSSGSIYVAEGFDGTGAVSQVQVYNATNNSLTETWTGSGSTLFQSPSGVAVNAAGTTVYVLDVNPSSGDGTVYALAPAATPTPITSWSAYNRTPLASASGIALDSNGNVYVANMGNYYGYFTDGQLLEFNPQGIPVASWSASSGNEGNNTAPAAVALDSSNNVYVADGNNNQLWVLSPSGSSFTVTTSWNLPSTTYAGYYGLAVDASKNVYVADYFNSQVEVYTNTGTLIGLFDGNQTGAAALVGPEALLLYNGNIYVGDFDNNNPIPSSSAGIIEIFGPDNY